MWEVSNLFYVLNEVIIKINEIMWFSLDVVLNGECMVFDMLGDLYKVSMSGGDVILLI